MAERAAPRWALARRAAPALLIVLLVAMGAALVRYQPLRQAGDLMTGRDMTKPPRCKRLMSNPDR